MNDTVKKFENKILRETKKIMKNLNGGVAILSKNNAYELDFELDMIEVENLCKNLVNQEDVNSVYETMNRRIYEQNKNELDQIKELLFLKNKLHVKEFFKDFGIVKKYLDKYGFTSIEQGEVLAYYLNNVLNYLLDEDFHLAEKAKEHTMKQINKKYSAATIDSFKPALEENMKRSIEQLNAKLKRLNLLRKVIHQNGDLLPNENAKDFKWILEDSIKNKFQLLEIDLDLVDIILESSEQKYKQMMIEKELKDQAEISRQQALEKKLELMAEQQTNRENAHKERKIAIQELKKYLKDELPIRYIEEFEILIIIELMKKIGYSKEQITATIKAINTNNLKLADDYIAKLNAEKEEEFRKLLQRHLTEEEQAIINEGISIADSTDAIKSGFYNLVLDDLKEIKSIILNLGENDSEAKEWLKLYISDLKNNIDNFKLSNYNYITDSQSRMRIKKDGDTNVE